MLKLKHQNIAGSMITVTDTSTIWSDLVNTAASTPGLKNAGFDTMKANGVNIIPLNGNIRFQEDGNDPTATEGQPLDEDYIYGGRNMSLSNLRLIRNDTTDVLCYIPPGTCNPHESTFISGAGGSSGGNEDLISTSGTYASITLTDADTEYEYTLTDDRKAFELIAEDCNSFKYRIGGAADSTATDYNIVKDGSPHWRQEMELVSGTVLRFRSNTAGQVIRISLYN